MKILQEYVRCVRNKKECVCSVSVARFKFRCNILISGKIIKEMPCSVASGTPFICYIIIFDMFRAVLCSSSGGQIVLLQHLVSSLSINGRTIRRLRAD